MKKLLLALVAVAAVMFAFAAPAMAQDQTLEVDPASVDAAGEHEINVSGTGFTVPVFILPCEGAGGDPAALTDPTTQCDLSALTPATPDADGNIAATVTFNVPEEGLVVAAGDQAGENSAIAVITVGDGGGEAEGGEGEGGTEGEGGEGEAEGGTEGEGGEGEAEGGTEGEGEETAETTDAELANTGVESGLLAIIGASVLAIGVLTVTTLRRSHTA